MKALRKLFCRIFDHSIRYYDPFHPGQPCRVCRKVLNHKEMP